MLKRYTVTVNGTSNGNTIAQPFTIDIHKIGYQSEEGYEDNMMVSSCTKNASGDFCENDDIKSVETFELPSMASSKNLDLTPFEGLLDVAYGVGNWS